MIPIPNLTGAIYGPTLGIARNLSTVTTIAETRQGGGDLNGTQATSILFSQAGTAGTAGAMPRAGNPGFGVASAAPLPPADPDEPDEPDDLTPPDEEPLP
jgi:hypothetical protein